MPVAVPSLLSAMVVAVVMTGMALATEPLGAGVSAARLTQIDNGRSKIAPVQFLYQHTAYYTAAL